jgi:hypothetical protein
VITALVIAGLSGAITSLAGSATYRAKEWRASPRVRLAFGGLAVVFAAVALAIIAAPSAAVGPGGLWAENAYTLRGRYSWLALHSSGGIKNA